MRDDGGHRIVYKNKEDIYKDKPEIQKPDPYGTTPNPVRRPKNL